MNFLISVIIFLIVISIVVIVHELGHFLAAIKNGVKVEEIAWGFPPKLWATTKKGVRVVVNLIPIGGYVKLLGDDGSSADDPYSLSSKPARKKIPIFLGGVTFNFILAFLIFWAIYAIGFKPIDPGMGNHAGIKDSREVVIDTVEKGSPAEQKGLQKGDVIKKVEGSDVKNSPEAISLIQQKAGSKADQPIHFTFEKSGKTFEEDLKTYKTKKTINGKEVEVNIIGVVLQEKGKIQTSFLMAPIVALEEVLRESWLSIVGIISLFSQLVAKLHISEQASGPVGIFAISGTVWELGGVSYVIQFVAMISIALAVINVFPIPALDGGHTMVVIIESIFRKKLPQKTKNIIQFAGLGIVLALIVVLSVKDVFTFYIK